MFDNNFKGVMTPLLIPLNEQEQLIESELNTHINALIEKGVHGFLSPSSTGEFANLPLGTRESILRSTVEAVNKRVPVVGLIGECGTKATIENCKFAQKVGADAVMATPPYYYPLDQPSLFHHFRRLADESEIPLWLYHQPNDTKLTIENETLHKLSEHPNIIGVKVSTNDLLYYHRTVRLFEGKQEFTVLMGEDHSFLPALSLGGDGVVSFLSNIIPETIITLWSSIKTGKLDQARKSQQSIMNCFEAFFTLDNNNPISACKLILKERGVFTSERSSEPFPTLSKSEEDYVIKKARELGLI